MRSPFSAPSASVISASSTSCSAVRTTARRNSSSSLKRALTSIVPDLPCLLVMVCILAKGSGDYASPAYHDHPPQQLLQIGHGYRRPVLIGASPHGRGPERLQLLGYLRRWVRFAIDSPLEESGFEPSVPRKMPAFWPASVSGSRRLFRRGKIRKRRQMRP